MTPAAEHAILDVSSGAGYCSRGMPANRIRAVIFDLDGTLLNTLPDIAYSINHALGQRGFATHPDDSYRTMVGSGMRVSVTRALEAAGIAPGRIGSPTPDDAPVGPAVAPELIESIVADVNETYAADPVSRTTYYDGIRDLLGTLASRGVPMAVLSNKPDLLVQAIAREYLAEWGFARVLGQRDELPSKPDPQTALEIAREMKVSPDQVIFVGDSDIDMETAHRAGMVAVGAAWGFRGAAELRSAGARIIVGHPSEILSLVS